MRSSENATIYSEVTRIEIAIIEMRFTELNIDLTLLFLYLCQITVTSIAMIIDSKNKV